MSISTFARPKQAKPSRRSAVSDAAATAMQALPTGKRFTAPYSKLFLSLNNVRQSRAPSPEGIKQLAALIEADGLLADLHVSAELKAGTPTGRYGVEAGGRRWRALGVLVSEGKLHADAQIDCVLVGAEGAVGVSLSENLGFEAMHPADEFTAYARLVGEGKTPEAVAARFGVTVVHVQRRMKLAAVAPVLLQLYRDGKATLDHMMALASIDDQKRQVAVWKALPDYNRTPAAIKRKLTEEEVNATDQRVKLITLARYVASGGATRQDLFTDEVFLTDPGLVDLLVAEVLTERAEAVSREGWSWVEIVPSLGFEERRRFVEPPPKYLPEPAAVGTQREALEAQLGALEDKLETHYDSTEESDEAQAAANAMEAEAEGLRTQLETLHSSLIDTSGYDKSTLGAVVSTEGGQFKILRGVMTADAAKAAAAESRSSGDTRSAGQTAGKARPEFAESLLVNLTSHRTGAIQAAMLGDQAVTLAALAARMAQSVLVEYGASDSPVKLSITQCRGGLERNASGFGESRAALVAGAQRQRWQNMLPEDDAQWFAWLLTQSQETVLALIVFCTSQSIDTVQKCGDNDPDAGALLQALNLDMSDWWQASADTYVSLVPKAKMIEAVTEALGAEAAKDLVKMKKAEAVACASAKLAGTRWLPAPLRRS